MFNRLLLAGASDGGGGSSSISFGGSSSIVATSTDAYWLISDELTSTTSLSSKGVKKDYQGNFIHVYSASNGVNYIFKLSPTGQLLYQRKHTFSSFGGSLYAFALDGTEVILVGSAYTGAGSTGGVFWIAKVDLSTNSIVWEKYHDQYVSYNYNNFEDVVVDNNSNIFTFGSVRDNNSKDRMNITKFNLNGSLVDTATFTVGSNNPAWPRKILHHAGDFYISGNCDGPFVAKILGSNLTVNWANKITATGTGQQAYANGIATDGTTIWQTYAVIGGSLSTYDPAIGYFSTSIGSNYGFQANTSSPANSYYRYPTDVVLASTGDPISLVDSGSGSKSNWNPEIIFHNNNGTLSQPNEFDYSGKDIEIRHLLPDNFAVYGNGHWDNKRILILKLSEDGTLNTGAQGSFDYQSVNINSMVFGLSSSSNTSNWSRTTTFTPNTVTISSPPTSTFTATTDISFAEQKVLGTLPSGISRVSGTGTLFKGATSTGSASSGWTTLQSATYDDGYQNPSLGFNWTINNTQHNSVYVGSNNYITFGGGQVQYSNYNFASWAMPKIILTMASDNSYQYLTYKQFTDYTRIRFEGNSSTTGVVGAGDIVWEATFFNPAAVGGKNIVEIRCGDNGRGNTLTMGIAGPSNSTAYASHSSLVNESVVYEGDSTGTIWTAYVGSKMDYSIGL